MNLENNLGKKFDPTKWTGWKAFKHYKYTGTNLVDDINNLDPDLVIDVGCGHNRFKGHIKNLIGFDQEPFPFADLHMSIENINFRKESADVVMALGSIQFGDKDFVKSQVKKIVSWVKPGGFIIMRTMKDWFHNYDYPYMSSHYIWSQDDINEIEKENSLILHKGIFTEEITDEMGKLISTRFAWWWQKPGNLKKYKISLNTCEIKERE